MVERAGTGLRFDTGIERIIRQDGSTEARLPEMSPILPSHEQAKFQLDEVFAQPSLGDALDAFVRPEIHERDILLPTRFAGLFHEVRDALRGATAARAEDAADLKAAAALLEEEQADRDLLEAYRNTLLGA